MGKMMRGRQGIWWSPAVSTGLESCRRPSRQWWLLSPHFFPSLPKPKTQNPKPKTQTQTQTQTLNPKPQTPNPKPATLNPKP